MKKQSSKFLLVFLILIPIIIVIYSYIPSNMIKLDADSKWEYFCANITHNLSWKFLFAIFVSGIITGAAKIVIEQLKRK